MRPSIQVDVDIHSEMKIEGEEESSGMMRALVMMKSYLRDQDNNDETGSLTLSSTRIGGRRRSSSSIRFADDTDTGTDILIITEEDLADILSDPVYGDVSSPARMMRRLSTPCLLSEEAYAAIPAPIAQHSRFRRGRRSLMSTNVQQHLLHGVFGMSMGGASTLVTPTSILASTASTDRSSRLLLTLRRRKSKNRSIHLDPKALLDYSYNKVVDRFLKSCSRWSFSSFTLDTLTGGHALSSILCYLFKEYSLIQHFNLDMLSLWKCFRKKSTFFFTWHSFLSWNLSFFRWIYVTFFFSPSFLL